MKDIISSKNIHVLDSYPRANFTFSDEEKQHLLNEIEIQENDILKRFQNEPELHRFCSISIEKLKAVLQASSQSKLATN